MATSIEQFISKIPAMKPAELIDWLVDLTEKSAVSGEACGKVTPAISAILAEIRKRNPRSLQLLKQFEAVANRLRREKSCGMWDMGTVQGIQREGHAICVKILDLFDSKKITA